MIIHQFQSFFYFSCFKSFKNLGILIITFSSFFPCSILYLTFLMIFLPKFHRNIFGAITNSTQNGIIGYKNISSIVKVSLKCTLTSTQFIKMMAPSPMINSKTRLKATNDPRPIDNTDHFIPVYSFISPYMYIHYFFCLYLCTNDIQRLCLIFLI